MCPASGPPGSRSPPRRSPGAAAATIPGRPPRIAAERCSRRALPRREHRKSCMGQQHTSIDVRPMMHRCMLRGATVASCSVAAVLEGCLHLPDDAQRGLRSQIQQLSAFHDGSQGGEAWQWQHCNRCAFHTHCVGRSWQKVHSQRETEAPAIPRAMSSLQQHRGCGRACPMKADPGAAPPRATGLRSRGCRCVPWHARGRCRRGFALYWHASLVFLLADCLPSYSATQVCGPQRYLAHAAAQWCTRCRRSVQSSAWGPA